MARLHTVLLALLPIFLILTVLSEVESAAVKDEKEKATERQGSSKVFVPASDASNFFKRRGRRSPKSYTEYLAEHKMSLTTSERSREYYDEQSNEYETRLEKSRSEQVERTRENNEQWREYHYEDLYPNYPHYPHYPQHPQHPYYYAQHPHHPYYHYYQYYRRYA
ncbi:upper zone of growth plate and cartilage matrix associated a [Neoarius graeffei]|uniref:upper zone of growth plate and cartilage matrix associated a n=1 Tax=Neoarius graeffei TaxID=443677 RepID=UPI00298C4C78|nr:upper zone of growth plate and cartilage matrix associated a [Neoarius graeffei]